MKIWLRSRAGERQSHGALEIRDKARCQISTAEMVASRKAGHERLKSDLPYSVLNREKGCSYRLLEEAIDIATPKVVVRLCIRFSGKLRCKGSCE